MKLPEKRQDASASSASSGNCQAAKAAKQKIDVKDDTRTDRQPQA
ncbi:hypothetical protein [Pseudomonas mosselii]|nr:hypothetical protein [Pseudomonas mosselii]